VVLEIAGRAATGLGIVSHLACSAGVSDGQPVLAIEALTAGGETLRLSLLAGEHSSEWAWDRPDVRGTIAHSRAPVFSSDQRSHQGVQFQAHRYLARFTTARPVTIRELRLIPLLETGSVTISKLTITGEGDEDLLLGRTDIGPRRWRLSAEIGQTDIWENRRALPRAWAVAEARALQQREILRAIRTSRLPGGERFRPRRTALLECGPGELPSIEAAPEEVRVEVVEIGNDRMRLKVHAPASTFIVVADQHYPGWRASVDGEPMVVRVTDMILRGFAVEAGDHEIVLDYLPARFVLGLCISILSAALIGGCFVRGRHDISSGSAAARQAP
jgi:hypothetical protein